MHALILFPDRRSEVGIRTKFSDKEFQLQEN